MSQKISAVLITREKAIWPLATDTSLFDEVIIEKDCPGIHRRFELAAQAKGDIIYVQDDDVSTDIRGLWSNYNGGLTYAITPGHRRMYDDLCGSRACLIGWGAFFPKRFADPARWQPYVDKFGPVPSTEADRVFTWFCEGHNPVEMLQDQLRQIYRGRAMSRDNPNHYVERDAIIKQLQSLEDR